ncbi:MAG: cell envelope biogenesis protein OmpA [Candidatus Zixiibacteriota bacterium]|nr:MAG: cell envelope biogenesis protein OmpA [candidate division Zixibacteria bacterium]
MSIHTHILNTRKLVVLAAALLLSTINGIAPAFADDVAGSSDHPMISRFEGARIARYVHRDFDEVKLPVSPLTGGTKFENTMLLEGEYTAIGYTNPNNSSIAAVYRSYSNALDKNGFEEIFKCNGREDCGHWFSSRLLHLPQLGSISDTDAEEHSTSRYLLTKLPSPDGDVYVMLYVYSNTYRATRTWLVVVKSESLQGDLIAVDTDAEAMAKGINEEGRIALYGILFDVNKSTIKLESKPTLEQISNLLNGNPDLKLVVVGHTDNQGELAYNMDLSTRRAKSVEATLVSDFGIAKDRLSAWGVGYLSPVASNRNEAGRTKNRRVELVEE